MINFTLSSAPERFQHYCSCSLHNTILAPVYFLYFPFTISAKHYLGALLEAIIRESIGHSFITAVNWESFVI